MSKLYKLFQIQVHNAQHSQTKGRSFTITRPHQWFTAAGGTFLTLNFNMEWSGDVEPRVTKVAFNGSILCKGRQDSTGEPTRGTTTVSTTTTPTTTTTTTSTTTTASTTTEASDMKKIFSHDTAGGFFSSHEDALSKNPDNPGAFLFSILDQLETYRSAEGKFHFKLCYPEIIVDGKSCNEWYQTSNPATDTTITGFQAVSLAFNLDSYNHPWAGLGRSPAGSGFTQSLIDDAPSQTSWWTALGATTYHGSEDKMPGPQPYTVKRVALYVQDSTTTTRSDREKRETSTKASTTTTATTTTTTTTTKQTTAATIVTSAAAPASVSDLVFSCGDVVADVYYNSHVAGCDGEVPAPSGQVRTK